MDYVCAANPSFSQNEQISAVDQIQQALTQAVLAQNQHLDPGPTMISTQNQTQHEIRSFFTEDPQLALNENVMEANVILALMQTSIEKPKADLLAYDLVFGDSDVQQVVMVDEPMPIRDPMLSSSSNHLVQHQNIQDAASADRDNENDDWEDVQAYLASHGIETDWEAIVASDGIETDGLRCVLRRRVTLNQTSGSSPAHVAKPGIVEPEAAEEEEVKPWNIWIMLSYLGVAVLMGGVLLQRFYF